MAAVIGTILFAYISLVFLVTHRICMMQCNPMSRPGVYQGDMGDIRFSGSHVEADGSNNNRREQPNIRHIRFEPSYLDFHEHSVGMPSIQTVSVINPHTDQSLQLQSVSGSTVHFHASFFQSKVVQPLGNTTFEIVFLARLVGNVENTLFIHTSKGVYPYQVFGVGVPNPYRLRPFLGARVPLNFSFSTIINMHNPYDSPLQVMEMYSSGGDLHLELPSGLEEAPQKHWEIPPYETKALMRVSFVGRVATNHTAFIRIKASQPTPNQELLILPVEVEVTTAPGLFSSTDMLDFGTLRTMDEPKSIGLYLLNAGHKQVHISAITVDPPNSALSISFTPALLKPGSKYVKIATATYSAYHVKRNRQATGKILIKTNSKISPRLEIPYQVNILQGTIAYSVSKTRFFVGKPPFVPVIRELPITNTFSFNMIIYDAAFPPEVEDVFSIVNFTKPAMIAPQKTVTPFYVQFHANGSDMAFSTILRVYTNASIFTVPIHCYDGKLKYVVEGLEEDVVEYGTVGTGENRTKLLRIFNLNPIEVAINTIACSLEFARIRLVEIKSNNESNLSKGNHIASGDQPVSSQSEESKVSIKPGYVALYSIEVAVPKKEGQYIGEIAMGTDYETLHVPIHLKSMDGKLHSSPASVLFQPGFPGRTVNHSLTLFSSFSHTLKLVSVKPYPNDDRFFFEAQGSEIQLLPNQRVQVGQLYYDPMRGCRNHCYMGIGMGKGGDQWLSSLSLPPNIGELDGQLIDKHQEMYSSIERSGKNKLNVSFVIDTDVVKGFQVAAQASLTWPSLSPDKPIKFPLTHLGNYSIKFFTLENPADVPVMAQIVPLSLYPQLQGVWDVLADRFDTDAYGFDPDDSTFTIPSENMHKDDAFSSSSSSLSSSVGVTTGDLTVVRAPGTMVTLLRPRATVNIPIQFQPKDERLRTSVVLIRNNLTILDGLVVQGQGARGEFTLNGKRPGIHSTLLFEIKPSQLTDCHKAAPRSRSLSSLSVMKTVTATNPGQLAMFVSSLSINGYECEGYGFKIMNCKSFILKPNTSRKIEITFTPDFTMSRVTRRLEVKTTLGPVMEFTLVATIPPHLLPLCSAALGRNSWEPVVQGVAVVLMGMVFLAVVIAAYAEARRLVFLSHPEMQLLQMKEEEQGTAIFDLNTIAGVKKHKVPVREEPTLGSRRSKRDARESKEASPVTADKTASNANHAAASLLNNLPTNNNIKNVAASTTRQEHSGNRSRNTRTELPTKSQPVESTEPHGNKYSSPPLESTDCTRRTWSLGKEGKSKSFTERKNVPDASGSRKVAEGKKIEPRSTDEGRRSDGKNRSCSVGAAEPEVVSVASSSKCESPPKRDYKEFSKEPKGKQKKKTKVNSRKEEKEQRLKGKEVATAKDREEDGVSDDSCSDGSSDKSVPEVRVHQPAKETKRPRRGSLPSDAQLTSFREPSGNSKSASRAATTESLESSGKDKGKNRKGTSDGKAKKADHQSQNSNARPKTLDIPSKSPTSQPSKSQSSLNSSSPDSGKQTSEMRGPGPTSPHAIAAAVMSLALGKSMQTSSKENNFDEQEKASKAYTKSTALSPTLSDSPPPMSPTSLSGSSRSSSYSSIVSSDSSSNGAEQVKLPATKGGKARVKSTKSAPMEGRGSPSWSNGSSGSRKSAKPSDDLGLSSLRRGRWAVSLDSAVIPASPRSPVAERPEVLPAPYMPSTRPSLLEHPPLPHAAASKPKQRAETAGEKVRPFDLNDLGLSDSSAARRRSYAAGQPSFWKGSSEKCYDNPDSLFSSSSRATDESFPGKSQWRSNNWVNFLDATSNTTSVVTSNKSMAEIWDVGNSPLDSDGWSVYPPVQQPPPIPTPAPALSAEANAVDALFSQMPAEWSAPEPESPFSTQEISWTPPPDVPSIWGNGYMGPATPSESLPTSPSASFVTFPVQPQQTQESTPGPSPAACTFEPLGSLGSSIWNPSTGPATWSTPSE